MTYFSVLKKTYGRISRRSIQPFGKKNERDRKAVQPRIDQINANYAEYAQLSDEALRNKTSEFRNRLDEHLSGIKKEIAQLDKRGNQRS